VKRLKNKLYNFLSRFILKQAPLLSDHDVRLIVDKCKNSASMKGFNRYLESQQTQGLLALF